MAIDIQEVRSEPRATAGAGRPPWPTLRRLIDSCAGDTRPWMAAYSGSRKVCALDFHTYRLAVRGLAGYLQRTAGIDVGDRVIVSLPNLAMTPVVHGALFYLGATAVPLPPAETRAYADRIATLSGARLAIHSEKATAVPDLEKVIVENDDPLRWAAEAPPERLSPITPLTLATIVFTSGTTGNPKGVTLAHDNWLVNGWSMVLCRHMTPGHGHMAVLPMYHVNALGFSLVGTLLSRARLILNNGVNPLAFWTVARAERADTVSVSPSVLRLLLEMQRDDRPDTGDVRRFVSAAAALSHDLVRSFEARFGLPIFQGYGLAEATNFSLGVPSHCSDAVRRAAMHEDIRPSAGTPVWGSHVEIMRDDGHICGPGESGEIVVRGPSVMQGYLDNPRANEEAFAGGWLHTGDLASYRMIGGSRFFQISGRRKEIVKVHGESIPLVDIDEELQRLPGLSRAVAVGFPNEHSGEAVGLFVVADAETPDTDTILARAAEVLGPYRRPRAVVFGDEIPVTSTGKIRRSTLTPRFADWGGKRL